MLISIIVPIYKVEPYLRQCVDSVLNQTYHDFELILVDDGSPDACPQICDECAAKDARVRVIHKQNGGPSSAREAGIHAAKGNYITILDGDDWLSVDTLQRCMAALEQEPDADCLIFSYVREYPDSSIVAHVLDGFCVLEGREAEERVYRRLFGLLGDELRHPERLESMGSCCMRLYRVELARQGRFFDTKEVGSSEDTLFNMYALYGCKKVVYLDAPFYHYRKTRGTITSGYRPHLIEQWGRLFDYMEAVIEEKQLGETYGRALTSRIALSILGIGSNELSAPDEFPTKVRRVRSYISTKRYATAAAQTDLSKMPLPWKTMLFLARNRMSFLLCTELAAIQFVRRRL